MKLRALVDAYGTLFDVHPMIELCDQIRPGTGNTLSQLWRAKQLEYTRQRRLMRRYQDFGGLRCACAALDPALLERAA
jgi:HAD superfamily hydrolase (TIGR01493 family)